jgi:hypothetical protein
MKYYPAKIRNSKKPCRASSTVPDGFCETQDRLPANLPCNGLKYPDHASVNQTLHKMRSKKREIYDP